MTQSMHNAAKKGFSSSAELYEQVRPNYPQLLAPWLKNHLGLDSYHHLLDLGAGTGKFIAELLKISPHITAIEPIAAMRQQLEQRYPAVQSLEGLSHAIPLPDQSIDAVFCAQAFHWFANLESLQDIARVLKPQGDLLLIWNQRDTHVDWVKALADYIEPLEGDTPRYHHFDWQKVFEHHTDFRLVQTYQIEHPHHGRVEDVVSKRLLSTSFIAALDHKMQQKLKQQFESIVEEYTQKHPNDDIVFPYQCYIYHYQKI